MTEKKKERLDKLIFRNNIVPTLRQAQTLIMAGHIIVDDHLIDKPGTFVSRQAQIRIKHPYSPYVSRGGEKLERPLTVFHVPVNGKTVLDVGASTGGFTDCLLQKGAARVIAVDVGYGQLAWKLQKDPRVVNLDRTHIRALTPEDVQPAPDIAVIDASFTSLTHILPNIISLISPDGEIICLIKPQFEAQREAVEKGGIVRDTLHYQNVIHKVVSALQKLHLQIIGIIESPIKGQKGNREFFAYAKKVNDLPHSG